MSGHLGRDLSWLRLSTMSLLVLLVVAVVAVFPSDAADGLDTDVLIDRLLDLQDGFLEGGKDKENHF